MWRPFRIPLLLVAILMLLGGIVWVKPDWFVNWISERRLNSEPDCNKRIALMNMSRDYSPTYWNPKYIQETLRANTDVERRFLADLVYERYGSNGAGELRALLSSSNIAQRSKTNVQVVVSFIEKDRIQQTKRH